MHIIINNNAKTIESNISKYTKKHSVNNVVIKSSQDIKEEMIEDIEKSQGIDKVIRKYGNIDVFIVKNCEDFIGMEHTFSEFIYFLNEIEKQGVKSVLAFETSMPAHDVKKHFRSRISYN